MTADKRFEETFNADAMLKDEKGVKTMCEFLDRVEARGEARGRAEALREVAAKIKAGYSIEEILAASQVQ